MANISGQIPEEQNVFAGGGIGGTMPNPTCGGWGGHGGSSGSYEPVPENKFGNMPYKITVNINDRVTAVRLISGVEKIDGMSIAVILALKDDFIRRFGVDPLDEHDVIRLLASTDTDAA